MVGFGLLVGLSGLDMIPGVALCVPFRCRKKRNAIITAPMTSSAALPMAAPTMVPVLGPWEGFGVAVVVPEEVAVSVAVVFTINSFVPINAC
jgi:hypothetical protein